MLTTAAQPGGVQPPLPRWPPHIGDPVRVAASGLVGEVVAVRRRGGIRHFTLALFALDSDDPEKILAYARAMQAARSTYMLDELEPA